MEDNLIKIRSAFKHLLYFCLSPPMTKWKEENRAHLFINVILVDADIEGELRQIEEMAMGAMSFQMRFDLFMDFFTLNQAVLLKLNSTDKRPENIEKLILNNRKINKLLHQMKYKLIR